MMRKIAIAMPCNRGIQPKTVESILKMIHQSSDRYEFHNLIATEGYTIAENRAWLVNQARKANCDYLLFIDDDMVFPPETFEQLFSHQKDVIGVPYYSRKLPRKSVIVLENGEVLEGELPNKIFKCQHVGTGVMLIKLSVFDRLDMPYFNFETHPTGFTLMGEDAWFCKQAREKGFQIWCDPHIEIKHIGEYVY